MRFVFFCHEPLSWDCFGIFVSRKQGAHVEDFEGENVSEPI